MNCENYQSLEYSFEFNLFHHTRISEILFLLSKHFPIKFIGYLRIYLDGTALAFSSNLEWQRFFLQKIDSNSSKNFEQATILANTSDKPFLYLWPDSSRDKTLNALHSYNIWNGMSLYRNRDEYIDSWSFAGEPGDSDLLPLFIKSTYIFEKFIEYVEIKYPFLFTDEALLHFKFSANRNVIVPHENYCTETYIKSFISHSPIFQNYPSIFFTKRKIEVLDLLSLGMTAKEIARELNISYRTVECHIHDLKDKLKCYRKSDLIRKYKAIYSK